MRSQAPKNNAFIKFCDHKYLKTHAVMNNNKKRKEKDKK
jgi:hypothetical protein